MLTLPFDGSYTLLLEGAVGQTGDVAYSFSAHRMPDDVADVQLGDLIDGTLDFPSDIRRYRFTLDAESAVYVDALKPDSSNFRWTLSGPRGFSDTRAMNASDAWANGSAPLYRLAAGTYELVVTAGNNAAGDFQIKLVDAGSGTPLTFGTPVESALGPGSETEVYSFDGTAGQRLFFDRQSLNGYTPYWRLISPGGRQVFGDYFNDIDNLVLKESGRYLLLVAGGIYYYELDQRL